MDVPYKYDKLRGRIIEKFGSQAKYAEALGVSEVTVSRKMNGNVGFSQRDMKQWGELLDISESDFGEYFFT